MLRVTLSGTLNFQFGAFTVLVVLHSCRGQHRVNCPSQPILATVGEEIILPAYLEPATNALRKTIEWTRPDLSPRYVHVQRQGVKLTDNHPSYEGRTSLLSDELKLGNISLKLSRVRISDEGPYRCFLPEMKISCIIQLVVGAASSPDVQMTVVLQCNSTGWYPEPEVFWLDGEGNLLSARPTETVRGPDDLYTVSSRVTVEKRHSNSFTCRVQQNQTNQIRETHIHVPDDFFEVQSSSSSTTVGLAVSLAVCILVILILGFVVWKFKTKRNSKHPESQVSGVTEEQTEVQQLMTYETVQMKDLNKGRVERKTANVSPAESHVKSSVCTAVGGPAESHVKSSTCSSVGGPAESHVKSRPFIGPQATSSRQDAVSGPAKILEGFPRVRGRALVADLQQDPACAYAFVASLQCVSAHIPGIQCVSAHAASASFQSPFTFVLATNLQSAFPFGPQIAYIFVAGL
ncbi:butyrophilin subfamily 3 member A2-like [Acanthopagrus schlegelii]